MEGFILWKENFKSRKDERRVCAGMKFKNHLNFIHKAEISDGNFLFTSNWKIYQSLNEYAIIYWVLDFTGYPEIFHLI